MEGDAEDTPGRARVGLDFHVTVLDFIIDS